MLNRPTGPILHHKARQLQANHALARTLLPVQQVRNPVIIMADETVPSSDYDMCDTTCRLT